MVLVGSGNDQQPLPSESYMMEGGKSGKWQVLLKEQA